MPRQRVLRNKPAEKREKTAAPTVVTLHVPSGPPIAVAPQETQKRTLKDRALTFMQQLAMQWSYRVRNRARWRDDAQARATIAELAEADLAAVGVGPAELDRIVAAGVVEVSTSYVVEARGWEARILPWEAVLAAATRARRQGQPLLVVRHLERATRRSARRTPLSALVVMSAPGKLGESYSFESERRLIEANLQAKNPRFVENPTREKLEALVRAVAPDVIHFTGVDAHQGATLLDAPAAEPHRDGLYLRGAGGRPVLVEAGAIAKLLTAGSQPPAIVTLNAYHTAARTAALLVAEGAGAAIGFQDEIDDALAERFFASFYRAWKVSNFDTLRAFDIAWREALEQEVAVRGSGIVLWSGRSLLRPKTALVTAQDPVLASMEQERSRPIPVTSKTDVRQILELDVKPLAELNYALLHNGGSLFEALKLRKFPTGLLRDVRLKVVLNVGAQSFEYRQALDLERPLTDVTRAVRIPLTWEYIRSMRETTRTSVYVEVGVGDIVVYSVTHPVRLLPVDEWRDTERDGLWLPSFVLPRDPAVADIVDRAQRYLMALRDDPAAGFDGYQSIDSGADDPYTNVDLQVQALWSAIVYDLGLSYINPPPTYTPSNQRLRSPSEVVGGKRGTCIDLALMLAACLEYVDIYPVIFLLEGHAFPGYWRSDAFQREFATMQGLVPSGESPEGQARGWMMRKEAYDEIVAVVRDDRLVPLETVYLTEHKGFGEATEGGLEDLNSKDEFEAMLDMAAARSRQVTPLPIRGSLQ